MKTFADSIRIRGSLVIVTVALLAPGTRDSLADKSEDKDGKSPAPASETGQKPGKAGKVGKKPFETPPGVSTGDLKEGVQLTELGCMRALLVMDPSAADVSKLITQRLVDADFRVFPAAEKVGEKELLEKDLLKISEDRYADLIVHAAVESSLRNKLGNFSVYEGEATLRVYSPVSKEIKATHTARADGERKADAKVAERSAREKAADAATGEILAKLLEKAHKMIVLEAEFHGVASREHLMKIIEYASRLDGVYHVRQMNHDKETKKAVIEIIAAPRAESFWRAYLERWPQPDGTVKKGNGYRFKTNDELRSKHADWFKK